jgi:Prp8 binding protein
MQRRSNSPVVSISVHGLTIAVGSLCGHVFVDAVFPTANQIALKYDIPGDAPVFGTGFSPDGRYLATLTAGGGLSIASCMAGCPTGNRVCAMVDVCAPRREVVPTRAAWSKGGGLLATGGLDSVLRIWDVENEENPNAIFALPGHKGTVSGVDFHPERPIIASGGVDGRVIVGELAQ